MSISHRVPAASAASMLNFSEIMASITHAVALRGWRGVKQAVNGRKPGVAWPAGVVGNSRVADFGRARCGGWPSDERWRERWRALRHFAYRYVQSNEAWQYSRNEVREAPRNTNYETINGQNSSQQPFSGYGVRIIIRLMYIS
jgi:hypothetical protein